MGMMTSRNIPTRVHEALRTRARAHNREHARSYR